MRYIRKFESHESKVAEKNKKHDYLNSIKENLISKMNHNPIDVWYEIDDRLTGLKDKFGTFVNKYDSTRPVIDFDDIDIEIDIKKESYYSLASISNYKWKRGDRVNLEEANMKYSVYSSSFDDEFLKYYERYKYSKTDVLKPFYSILIGFDGDYIMQNKEKYNELGNELGKEVSSALHRIPYTIKIKNIEYFDANKYTPGSNSWIKIPPSFDSLKDLSHPRIYLSFFVD